MKITYLGHNCLFIETAEHKIMVDPFISGNPLASNIQKENYLPDFIILTHAHVDHVLDVEVMCTLSSAKIISNYEIVTYYEKKGFTGHGMNTGGNFDFPFGKVGCVVAQHSSVFNDGTYGGNPNGYIIQTEEKTIYIAGDTSLTYDMKLIPQLYGKVDLAIVPIGDNFTMNAKAAATAMGFVDANKALGTHYDTFPPIKINHNDAKNEFSNKGKELILLDLESSIEL